MKEISFNLIDNILVFGNAQLSTQLLALTNRDILCSISRAGASFCFPLICFRKRYEKLPSVRLELLTSGLRRHCSECGQDRKSAQSAGFFDENDLLDQEDSDCDRVAHIPSSLSIAGVSRRRLATLPLEHWSSWFFFFFSFLVEVGGQLWTQKLIPC